MKKSIFLLFVLISLTSCSPIRHSLPAGEIPKVQSVSNSDQEYGSKVAYELSQKFPLDDNYENQNRVRAVVEKLTKAANADSVPWRVYVYKSSTFRNAAATKGNVVFIWTAMLDYIKSDGELAAILGHEIGHVLAGHTEPDPYVQTSSILSGIAGAVANQFALSKGYSGDITEAIVKEAVNAMIVNPELQRTELEADSIGLFLMADAGYDPADGVNFWKRAARDPEMSGSSIPFLSTHPSSSRRVAELERLLPQAQERFRSPKGIKRSLVKSIQPGTLQEFRIMDPNALIFSQPDSKSKVVSKPSVGAIIKGEIFNKEWIIVEKSLGYTLKRFVQPAHWN